MTEALVWAPTGAMTFDTAHRLRRECDELKPAHVDLTGVTEADSTALALLVALARGHHEQGRRLSISAMPSGMSALADLYGVSELFDSSLAR